MSTPEQIKDKLHQIIYVRAHLDDFVRRWPIDILSDPQWNEDEFIRVNIHYIVAKAMKDGQVNRLGMTLGFPSDEQESRTKQFLAARCARLTIILAALSLIVGMIALLMR